MYLYYSGATSSPSTAIPPASSLRSIPLIEPGASELPLMSVPVSLSTTTLVGSGSGLSTNPVAASNPLPLLHTTDAAPLSGSSTSQAAVTLSSALPPIPARVVEKICAGQFCEFKEMLADNIALRQTLLETSESTTSRMPLARLREISDPLTWAFCFLAFVAVRTKDQETRELAAYGQLIIHLARQHGGTGWLAYDKRFRQHQAVGIGHPWNELNPSLMAATVLRRDSGGKPGQSCSKCASSDHEEKDCALSTLDTENKSDRASKTETKSRFQPYPTTRSSQPPTPPSSYRPYPVQSQEACLRFNSKESCNKSAARCRFRHVCSACLGNGHTVSTCPVRKSVLKDAS